MCKIPLTTALSHNWYALERAAFNASLSSPFANSNVFLTAVLIEDLKANKEMLLELAEQKLIDDSWTVEYGAGVKDENGALFNLKNFICTDMECFMDSHNLLGCRNTFGEFPVGYGRA